MRNRIVAIVVGLIVVGAFAGVALATPVIGTITAETARGPLDEAIKVNTGFENGASVKLQTRGPIEVITQRIVADPGSSFGWHSHPGENVNVVFQGTLTLYHDEACTEGTTYETGDAFSTSPDEIHLAHAGAGTQLILFATYFAPITTPLMPVRIDQPLPQVGCPA